MLPTVLVYLFWIWLVVSVSIYVTRIYRRLTGRAQVATTDADEGSDELPLDSPDRWKPLVDDDSDPTATSDEEDSADTATSAESPASDESDGPDGPGGSEERDANARPTGLPVKDIFQRLPSTSADAATTPAETVAAGDGAEIEPAVLAAMAPEQRARLGRAGAGGESGGLFDTVAAAATTTSVGRPLRDVLGSIELPCDLVPFVTDRLDEHQATFVTRNADQASVAVELGRTLEQHGFAIESLPPTSAIARKGDDTIEVEITAAEDDDNVTVALRSV